MKARGGDARAYEALVRRYQDLAFRTAFVIAGGSADAEDAAQEGFVKAWYALPRFRAGSPLRPWLLAIVANEARNRRRSGRRQDDLAVRVAEDRPSGDAAPSPRRRHWPPSSAGCCWPPWAGWARPTAR